MIIAVTGHRPDRLGGYGREVFDGLTRLASSFLEERQPEEVITGMALGWDLAVAAACASLDVPFHAAVPFAGQEERWTDESKIIYRGLMLRAKEITIVSEGRFSSWKLHKRNEWMVDRCDELAALFDGVPRGGTNECMKYARRKGVKVSNLWPLWRAAYAE